MKAMMLTPPTASPAARARGLSHRASSFAGAAPALRPQAAALQQQQAGEARPPSGAAGRG